MDERLRDGDDALLPDSLFGLSINEFHSLKLGCVGVFIGAAFATGYTYEAVTFAFTLAGYAILGHPVGHAKKDAAPSIGIRTIRREPWYFLCSLLVTFGAGLFAVAYAPDAVATALAGVA